MIALRFIKTISLMIEHTAVLHQAPPNKVDESIQFQFEDISVLSMDSKTESNAKTKAAVVSSVGVGVGVGDEEKREIDGDGCDGNVEVKPIENQDIKRMQDIAFDLFKKFNAQSHREVLSLPIYRYIDLMVSL